MKTKQKLLFLGLIIAHFQVFAQSKSELRLYYGTSSSDFSQETVIGGGDYDNQNLNEFGLVYLTQIAKNIKIETGFNFSTSDVVITPAFTGEPVQTRYEKLDLISIPLYLQYDLKKYLFINSGLLLDIQTSENTIDEQSGIGYGFGIGAKYHFDTFYVFINPNFKIHAVIPFQEENYQQKLTEIGIQIGLGLDF